MLGFVTPHLTHLQTIDFNGDGFSELEFFTLGYQQGGTTIARSHHGKVPRKGFKLGGVLFTDRAKAIAVSGTFITATTRPYAVKDRWVADRMSSVPLATVNEGVNLVVASLVLKNYGEAD